MQKTANFEQVMKSFLGFLVGTKKSELTVSSYKSDLLVFQEFLRDKKLNFATLSAKDLAGYDYFLTRRGLKANTRRRKLLTAKALYRYALRRKKISESPAQFLKTPARRDNLPWIPSRAEVSKLLAVPAQSALGRRNKVLFLLLAETGLGLSEACALRWDEWSGAELKVLGKRPRTLKLSTTLQKQLGVWRKDAKGDFIFPGFNRHGFFTKRMTSRGVEMAMQAWAAKLEMPEFKPKSFRHYAILHWLHKDIAEPEILRRLGVRQAYPLQPYREYLTQIQRDA